METQTKTNPMELLTAKQRDVLDLMVQHKSSKEIARALQISPYTVDQRVASARARLGASSRSELARIYSGLAAVCERSAYETSHMASEPFTQHEEFQVAQDGPVFTLSDSAHFDLSSTWNEAVPRMVGLEALDRRFGIFGRVLAIASLAFILAILVLVVASIATTLSAIL